MEKKAPIIYDKNTVEFVTVAAECCGFLEKSPHSSRRKFLDTSLKLLPLLYLKASLLSPVERMDESEPETFVTEGDYERVRAGVASVLREHDDYLDVFVEDMAYSDTPIRQTISENMADIYQSLKDFVCVYELGLDRTMNDALLLCEEQFRECWGQRLLNAMRALHDVRYGVAAMEEEEEDMDYDVPDDSVLYDGLDMGEDDGQKVGEDDGNGDRWEF
ncbi:MAG: DUF5063 domain-containing protein [Bacteroidales bacterium]|nr:DUF5063 domain-containing protein [Bacteroidales bacterium]